MTEQFSAGDTIGDVMREASHVKVPEEGRWFPILGYDEWDDVLCVENFNGPDWEFAEASQIFSYRDFKIAVEVTDMEFEND